jgi:hypothetical protein
MAHARQQIRDRVVTTLTGLTTTGANVFSNRVYRLGNTELPCWLVFMTDESSEPLAMGATTTIRRQVQIEIEGRAIANADIADLLDTMSTEAEAAIGADHTLGGLVKDIILTRTEIALTGDGEQVAGIVRMTFDAVYVTATNNPETLL